ncbi:hypothetical protein GF325_15400 [Candidatus Bathyarchaeota archaeon]|nr:hypothetical protein [Candidatus Bathyarchaeota archaeon]
MKQKGQVDPKEKWNDVVEEHRLLMSTAAVGFGCSGAGWIYLHTTGSSILTSTTVSPSFFLFPPILLSIITLAAMILAILFCALKPIIRIRRHYLPMLSLQFSIAVVTGAFLVHAVTYLTSNKEKVIELSTANSASLVHVTLEGISTILSILLLLASNEHREKTLVKYNVAKFSLEGMGFMEILKRGFYYLLKHFWQILLVFILFIFLGRLFSLLVLSPWEKSIYLEEQALIAWFLDNNFAVGSTLPADIAQRVNSFYWMQQVYLIINNAVNSTFYYIALGVSVYMVIKSYRGAFVTIGRSFSRVKKNFLHLIIVSIIFSFLYNLGIRALIIPGIIVYVICIMVFPNVTVIGKYKILENFGRSKDLLKKNIMRTGIFSVVIILLKLLVQTPVGSLSDRILEGFGSTAVLEDWVTNPLANAGSYVIFEFLDSVIRAPIGTIETVFVAIMFIDLRARTRDRIELLSASSSKSARNDARKQRPMDQRIKKATRCRSCGIFVPPGTWRCPNCKEAI